MNLLLVDDDSLLRNQIRFSIETLFEKIYESDNKSKSFKILEQYNIDIALVDLHLDDPLDGQEIAKVTVEKNIKTIIFTANIDQITTKELIKEGVFDYLNKPVDIPTLKAALNRAKLFKQNEIQLAKENIYHLSQCVDVKDGIKESLKDIEKDLLIKILKENDFNIYQAAKLLNMKRENIYYFIKKYNIQRDQ